MSAHERRARPRLCTQRMGFLLATIKIVINNNTNNHNNKLNQNKHRSTHVLSISARHSLSTLGLKYGVVIICARHTNSLPLFMQYIDTLLTYRSQATIDKKN